MFLLEHFPGINSSYPFCLEGRGFFKRLWGRNLPFYGSIAENWKAPQDTIQEERVDILRLEDEVDAVVGFL